MITGKLIDGYGNISEALKIRNAVFAGELLLAELETKDERDLSSVHIVIYNGNTPVSCGRLTRDGENFIIDKVATLKEHRGQGYADLAVRMLIRKAFDSGTKKQLVSTLKSAEPFFARFGFTRRQETTDESGTEHVIMERFGDIGCMCE